MQKTSYVPVSLIVITLACMLCVVPFVAAQSATSLPLLIQASSFGASPVLRDLSPSIESGAAVQRIIPLRHQHSVPNGFNPAAPFDVGLQLREGPAVGTTAGLNFLGLGKGFSGYAVTLAPPDTNASVGSTQVVETVNVSFEIFNKTTGAKVAGPFKFSDLFTTGNNCQNGFQSDPIVKWDNLHLRWVISFLAATNSGVGPFGVTAPFLECVAVSQTSDATGSYWLYSFDLTSLGGTDGALNDYPKLGVWPNGYFMSFNEYDAVTGNFAGAAVCALQSNRMISGMTAKSVCFSGLTNDFTLLPSDLDGANSPGTEPNFYVGTLDGSSHFNLWKFKVNFTTPASSTFTGPKVIKVNSYSETCGGGTCIAQPSPGEQLESAADRPMHRAAYRKFTGTGAHESIVFTHSVVKGATSGIRWYELRNPNGTTPTLFQQGTYGPSDGNWRWMGSAAMDKVGDLAVGYSVSGTALDPSVRYTGRVPSDAVGTLETEKTIIKGTGVQESTNGRWGDYSSMAVDPSDDCTFWYAQQYIKTTGSFSWSTRLASFKFPGCQ